MSADDIEDLRADYRQLLSLLLSHVDQASKNAGSIDTLTAKIDDLAERLAAHMDDEEGKITETGVALHEMASSVQALRDQIGEYHQTHHQWISGAIERQDRMQRFLTDTGGQVLRMAVIGAMLLLGVWISDGFFLWLNTAMGR